MQRENFNSKAEQKILVGVYLLAEGEKKEISPTVTELSVCYKQKLLPNPTFYNQATKKATLLMRSPQLLLYPGAPAVTVTPQKSGTGRPRLPAKPQVKEDSSANLTSMGILSVLHPPNAL